MNRHERRKKAAQERRARGSDTMGSSYSTGPLPDHVRQHPAFKRGLDSAKTGEVPEGYHKAIEDAARLMREWVRAQPTMPDLRWLPEKDDGVFISAALDAGAAYLADSPDAFRLLAWLDEQTGHQLSLNQTKWALRLCRAMPMRDGSYHGVETVRQSAAMKNVLSVVDDDKCSRHEPSPCGHCGKQLDAASSDTATAKPGDVSVCMYCTGVNRFDEGMRLVAVNDAELAALPDDMRAVLEEMQALVRRGHQLRAGPRKGPVGEA